MSDMPTAEGPAFPSISVCFSGPRPTKLPDGGNALDPTMRKITQALSQQIQMEAQQGMIWFITGIMAGFDVIAGEAVLRVRNSFPQIRLALIAPFRKGYFATEYWTPDWRERALELCRCRDYGLCLHDTYTKGVYYERDRFMVEHACKLICYYNGQGGGTKYTVEQAQKAGLEIHNLVNSI